MWVVPARSKSTQHGFRYRVKCFRVRNRCGFINRNDSKEDMFAHKAAKKKNKAEKHLHSAGDGDTMESDAAEGAKWAEAAKITGPGGVPAEAINTQQTHQTCNGDRGHHITGILHAITSRITRIVRVRKIMRGHRVLPKARTNSTHPTSGDGSHLTTCGDPTGVDHSISSLLCREK